MKKDKIKHIVIGLTIFLISWYLINSDYALLITGAFAFGKEFNDATGIIKPFLSKGKKTGFDIIDIIYTLAIPLVIQVYLVNFN